MSERKVYWHPSGPNLTGQPKCSGGHIWSHKLHKCIPIVAGMKGTKDSLAKIRELTKERQA